MNKYEALLNSYGAVVLPTMEHNLNSYPVFKIKPIEPAAAMDYSFCIKYAFIVPLATSGRQDNHTLPVTCRL
jgi:hypothetical protein